MGIKTSYAVHQASLDALIGSYLLKLYTNNYSPAAGMTPSSFTECSGGGYAHATIATANWSTEYSNAPRDIILPEQTFAFTGVTTGATIYGYYFISLDLATVKMAKALDTPYSPSSGGGTLKFTPRIQAGNGTPA